MGTSDDCFRLSPTTQHTDTSFERPRSPPHPPATGSWRERYNSRYGIRTPESANGPRRIRSNTPDRSPPQSIGRGGFGSGSSDRTPENVRGPRQARARSRDRGSRSGSVSEGHQSPEDDGESRKKVDWYDAGQTGRGGAGNIHSERYSPGSSGEGESRKKVHRYPMLPAGVPNPGSGMTSPSWPQLEFDDEDEDFLLSREDPAQEPGPAVGDATSRATSRCGPSILTSLSTQPNFFDHFDSQGNFEDERGWS
jgi:hypothetical protein